MNRTSVTVLSLGILMAGYAFHSRNTFILYHVVKLAGLLLGHHR
jgi:hypothetical protein